ncbi:MAG TPA: DUF1844 domain-containing protein [Terracidiphilus sp.]|nr:DUF1844 domain-containing protein [Terracidiphilus sp.]
MSDTPKFEVIDRRKIKAEEEKEGAQSAPTEPAQPAAAKPSEPAPGPRLVVNESPRERTEEAAPPKEAPGATAEPGLLDELPPPPTAAETHQQKAAYDASAQRLEDLIRAQNPTVGPQPPVGFEHLVQQFYVTAMLQMGAGTQEGQRPRVDIMGARATIDLLGVLAEKTRGNLTPTEDRMLQTVLFEARMAFLELTSMMSAPTVPPAPPAKK